jgi:hypothetical protein
MNIKALRDAVASMAPEDEFYIIDEATGGYLTVNDIRVIDHHSEEGSISELEIEIVQDDDK